jgi:hypothetical protein
MTRTTTPAHRPAVKLVRCADYTRKSTEEGLEQEFNSLDAKREAGEAYVRSQTGEGWVALPDRYDDGGFTGGNTDRPGLRRLNRTRPKSPHDRGGSPDVHAAGRDSRRTPRSICRPAWGTTTTRTGHAAMVPGAGTRRTSVGAVTSYQASPPL